MWGKWRARDHMLWIYEFIEEKLDLREFRK